MATRRFIRGAAIPASLLAVLALAGTSPSRPSATLERACEYLWSKQGSDGAWRSETHGLLRSGAALTPFILDALLAAEEVVATAPRGGVERALAWLRGRVDARGVLGTSDGLAEYPNYSTSFALRCFVRAGAASDAALIARMIAALRAEQFREENGFSPRDAAYGGWGFGGARPTGSTGHMDLSITRHVLAALRHARALDGEAALRAQLFLRHLQKHPEDDRPHAVTFPGELGMRRPPYDGGFYFSPVVLTANKGGIATTCRGERYFRSYATATCEGVLALIEAGTALEDERVRTARRWLEDHPSFDYPEGVPADDPNGWRDALTYYHLAVRAETYRVLDMPGAWRAAIATRLAALARARGGFRNDRNHLMKDDDPLIATPLAVLALTATLSSSAERACSGSRASS